MNYKVCGMREELYIGQDVSGHNCDFEYTDKEMTRHVILLKGEDGSKVELTLQQDQGECCSGWCPASYGVYEWDEVKEFAGKTHTYSGKAIKISPNCLDTGEGDFICEAFSFSVLGGCGYYPAGGYSVNDELFTPIFNLPLSHRPVHIFYGDSNTCKSYISALTGKTVFETDSIKSVEELPDEITADIVVVGNRWKCDLSMIKERLFGEPMIVEVEFKHSV